MTTYGDYLHHKLSEARRRELAAEAAEARLAREVRTRRPGWGRRFLSLPRGTMWP